MREDESSGSCAQCLVEKWEGTSAGDGAGAKEMNIREAATEQQEGARQRRRGHEAPHVAPTPTPPASSIANLCSVVKLFFACLHQYVISSWLNIWRMAMHWGVAAICTGLYGVALHFAAHSICGSFTTRNITHIRRIFVQQPLVQFYISP